jgi:hypothetical protein
MALEGTAEATNVGQGIAGEGLQIVLNIASYRNSVEAGTYLLALLGGIEHKAREIPGKPCAVLVTDARPFCPANDDDCLIKNTGVAQQVYDILLNLLENAGQAGMRSLAVYLSMQTLDGVEDEVLPLPRLFVVSGLGNEEQVIKEIAEYLDLSSEEIEQLQDGDALLYNAPEAETSFVRFRRSKLKLVPRWLPSEQRKTEELIEENPVEDASQGESAGLKED